MAYILNGVSIRRPAQITESNDKQMAQNRTLDGSINRDFFGSRKRVWRLEYQTTNATDYSTIKTIYDSYQSTGTTQSWQVTETNYTVAATTVHVDLIERSFRVRGTDYLSDFDLILTEE